MSFGERLISNSRLDHIRTKLETNNSWRKRETKTKFESEIDSKTKQITQRH